MKTSGNYFVVDVLRIIKNNDAAFLLRLANRATIIKELFRVEVPRSRTDQGPGWAIEMHESESTFTRHDRIVPVKKTDLLLRNHLKFCGKWDEVREAGELYYAAEVILKSLNIIFTQIQSALNLDKNKLFGTRIFDAMR